MVFNFSYIPVEKILDLQEFDPWSVSTDQQIRQRFELYVSVLENSGFNFSNQLNYIKTISDYREFRFVINCIKNIVYKSLDYARHGLLDNIVQNISLDFLTPNNLNLFKDFSSGVFTSAFYKNQLLNFDANCFKKLMNSGHNLWLLPIYNEYKLENDDDSTYNKIENILDFQYQYLINHPNYLNSL